ncbi:MAG: ATP/GTP-binding protein [Candidatus Hodarchaeota archaeon]
MTSLLVLGAAGSGKTTLVKALSVYLRQKMNDINVFTCNLDPGSDDTFSWDKDIRNIFTIKEIMNKYNIGPNGAIEKAYSLLMDRIDDLFENIEDSNFNYLIIDAPGQLEPLIFTETGNKLLEKLNKCFNDLIGVFLMPGDILNVPSNYAFLLLVLSGLHLKINIPLIHVISKHDLLETKTLTYLQDPKSLKRELISEQAGELTDFTLQASEMVQNLLPVINLVKISIQDGKSRDFDDLLGLIDETKCSCGDLS